MKSASGKVYPVAMRGPALFENYCSCPDFVIHLLTEQSIEERVWETLRLKKALFAGRFDGVTGEISSEKLGRRAMMQTIKEVFADQERAAKPAPQPARCWRQG